MVNYCNKYIKDYPTITASLRLLTKKKQRFRLGTAQQDAFETLQERLTSAEVMLFIILTQMLNLLWMVVLLVLVLYLPRSNQMVTSDQLHMALMHSVQQRYSQTEREALPFLWSCQHFHHYVYDCHVTIITDHKPLLQIFSSKSQPPPRIQRWMLRLQWNCFEIKYIPGREWYQINQYDSFRCCSKRMHTPGCTLKELIYATKTDDTLQQVMKFVTSGRWSHDSRYHIYRQIHDQLLIRNDLLLKRNCIVIPLAFHQRVL